MVAALGFEGWGPVAITQDVTKPIALMLWVGGRCGTLPGGLSFQAAGYRRESPWAEGSGCVSPGSVFS